MGVRFLAQTLTPIVIGTLSPLSRRTYAPRGRRIREISSPLQLLCFSHSSAHSSHTCVSRFLLSITLFSHKKYSEASRGPTFSVVLSSSLLFFSSLFLTSPRRRS